MSDAWLFVLIVFLLGAALALATFAVVLVTRVLVLGTGALARWAARLW